MQILAELSAPCPVGADDCLKLEQLLVDRSSRLMVSWRERAPSTAVGVHAGMVFNGSLIQRARVSTDADASYRVLLAAPRKYSVMLKEASTWKALLFDVSTTGKLEPTLSDKVATTLTDELVRNFTMTLSVNSANEDNELNTLGYGATAGTVDLAGPQGKVAVMPVLSSLTARPVRERFMATAGYLNPAFLWLGTTAQGQAFHNVLVADGSGNYNSTYFLGSPRATTSDAPGCRNGSPGFPSVSGVLAFPSGLQYVGWLESNDAGTACNLVFEGTVFNAAGTHVRKLAMNDMTVIWEQQATSDRSGPTEVMMASKSFASNDWGPATKVSSQPVSRLLAQASGPGSSPWIAGAWQECASAAADAVCKTYVVKSQGPLGTGTEVGLSASSVSPLATVNYAGTAVLAWVEPRAACKADATKQCAQIRVRWF